MKIRIVTNSDVDKIFSLSKDLEYAINRAIEEIEKIGVIIDIIYLRSNTGYLHTAIIEYKEK